MNDLWDNDEPYCETDEWDYDEITKSQKKYILDLVSVKKGFRLAADLDNLTKDEAGRLIQDLQDDNESKLVEERILVKVMSKREFVERIMYDKKMKKA
jgi:hypothetical protein